MVAKKKSNRKQEEVITNNPWMIACVALAVLLIASIFTSGFNLTSNTDELEQVQSLKNSVTNNDLKQQLESYEKELIAAQGVAKAPSKEYNGDALVITEYSDFECPYCEKAEPSVQQIREEFGDAVIIDYKQYPLNFHPNAQKAAEASECARDQDKFWEYHDVLFDNQRALDVTNLKKYASNLGLNTAKFNSCLDNGDKAQLVKSDFDEGAAAGVSGTPTFFIDGEKLVGAQPYDKFLDAICSAIPTHPKCSDRPIPEEIEMIVVNDVKCGAACDSTQIVSAVKQMFPGLKARTVDVSSSEGKELVGKFSLEVVPAYIIDSKIENEAAYTTNAQLQQVFQKIGTQYKIVDQATGATWFVDSVKRDAYLESLKIPQTEKPEIELFVMSHCPYGTQSEKGILPVIRSLGDKVDFKIRFVYYAMHGEKEVTEQLNQYCIQKEQEDVYLDYLACFLKDGDGKACLTASSVDTTKMNTCVAAADAEFGIMKSFNDKSSWLSGNYPLFGTDAAKNTKYSVGGSPTLIINGKDSDAGRNPASYQQAICDAFIDKPEECNTPLDSSNPSAGFGYGTAAAATAAGCGV